MTVRTSIAELENPVAHLIQLIVEDVRTPRPRNNRLRTGRKIKAFSGCMKSGGLTGLKLEIPGWAIPDLQRRKCFEIETERIQIIRYRD